jgi:hypothetical protein
VKYLINLFSVDERGDATRTVEAEHFEYHSDHVVFYKKKTSGGVFEIVAFMALHVSEVAEISEVPPVEFHPPFTGFDLAKKMWESTYPVTPEPPETGQETFTAATPVPGDFIHTGDCPCTDCALKDSLPHEAKLEPDQPSEGVGGSDCL